MLDTRDQSFILLRHQPASHRFKELIGSDIEPAHHIIDGDVVQARHDHEIVDFLIARGEAKLASIVMDENPLKCFVARLSHRRERIEQRHFRRSDADVFGGDGPAIDHADVLEVRPARAAVEHRLEEEGDHQQAAADDEDMFVV